MANQTMTITCCTVMLRHKVQPTTHDRPSDQHQREVQGSNVILPLCNLAELLKIQRKVFRPTRSVGQAKAPCSQHNPFFHKTPCMQHHTREVPLLISQ